MISICLSLGNVEFEDPDVGEGCIITTPETLELVAEMMQIAPEDLGQAVTSKTMGGGVIEVPAYQNPAPANVQVRFAHGRSSSNRLKHAKRMSRVRR